MMALSVNVGTPSMADLLGQTSRMIHVYVMGGEVGRSGGGDWTPC